MLAVLAECRSCQVATSNSPKKTIKNHQSLSVTHGLVEHSIQSASHLTSVDSAPNRESNPESASETIPILIDRCMAYLARYLAIYGSSVSDPSGLCDVVWCSLRVAEHVEYVHDRTSLCLGSSRNVHW